MRNARFPVRHVRYPCGIACANKSLILKACAACAVSLYTRMRARARTHARARACMRACVPHMTHMPHTPHHCAIRMPHAMPHAARAWRTRARARALTPSFLFSKKEGKR